MYEISRAMKPGVPLTAAQRSSSLFAEEPTVLGKTLRRGGPSMLIEDSVFLANKVQLERLIAAGSIEVKKLGGIAVVEEVQPVTDAPNTITVDPTAETVPGAVPPDVIEAPIPVLGDVAPTLEVVPGVEAVPLAPEAPVEVVNDPATADDGPRESEPAAEVVTESKKSSGRRKKGE